MYANTGFKYTHDNMGYICKCCGTGNFSHGASKCANCESALYDKIKNSETLSFAEYVVFIKANRIA